MMAALLGAAAAFAQEEAAPAPAQEAAAPAQEAAGKRNRVAELQALESELDNYYAGLKQAGVAAATPVYVEAKGRLKAAQAVVQPKPGSKEAALAFSMCSTQVAAALLQFEREANLVKARQMMAERDSLMNVLHNLHEAISRIEGGRAYRLSQDLEASKAKSSLLQGDLEATKANLAAERARARKIMEDAQKRFSELQSELISVSRDARGTIISMADILFESGKADLTHKLKEDLAKIAGILIVYKDPKLVVEGHTDNQGSKEFNQKLSEDRAANVKNYLIERGVAAERLSSIGSAFDKPIADNKTAAGRAKNRRVDLIIEDHQAQVEDGEEGAAAAPAAPAHTAPAPAHAAPAPAAPAPAHAAPAPAAPAPAHAAPAPAAPAPAHAAPAPAAPAPAHAAPAPAPAHPAPAPAPAAPARPAPAKQ